MRGRIAVLVFFVLTALPAGVYTVLALSKQADPPNVLETSLGPTVFRIYYQEDPVCTGFLARIQGEPKGVTAGHCVLGSFSVKVNASYWVVTSTWRGISEGIGKDFAVFRGNVLSSYFKVFDIGDIEHSRLVFIDGFGYNGRRATVCHKVPDTYQRAKGEYFAVFECTVPIMPGMSGSPVIDTWTGKVVGVLTHRDENNQRLTYVSSFPGILELVGAK